MKQQRAYARCTVTPKGERAIVGGHPWVYEGEVVSLEGDWENGGLVDVVSQKGRYLGTGFLSQSSKIRVRLISRNANDTFDAAFWARRVRYAWEYRKSVMGEEDVNCCRLIFGEADSFPGLTVDRFSDLLVTQTLSLGMERLKPLLFPLLRQVLEEDGQAIRGIYERNDVALRVHEGLEEGKGWFPLESCPTPGEPRTQIVENGIRYEVDVENGQKTGFFLDQKYNRQAVAKLARGKRVLDCFTHTGSFALNAAKGGAAHVTAVDVSESAVELARENARLNGLDQVMECQAANVFDLLPELERQGGHPYDFIILDPPAFTKSRRTVDSAARGYKEINYRAMKLLPRGGYLATCSCSHFMETGRFVQMLRAAAYDAGVQLRQIEARQQAPDHPILWNVPETDYLKFFLFQVV
ncbi:MAG TPA: class I SAM-dependent rRNA methyltransferase [Candidatus Flavonifractor merdigallinarum]|uniref:Class I SAM-dependent rRNA methyltransferase n=1 Tax=Candidatus Flavonifractor merdigallinarum TaxID=2838589 RepID=A0A9D1Y8P3_9FIRM|nr:class I SAM-dependent rRNA methyltransferase [Candidatus Flavonifractor merdigallinarum]